MGVFDSELRLLPNVGETCGRGIMPIEKSDLKEWTGSPGTLGADCRINKESVLQVAKLTREEDTRT